MQPIGYAYDGDIYCENCIGDKRDAEETGAMFSWDEADSPQCCGACHAFIGGSLTADGIDYVADKIEEALERHLATANTTLAEWFRHYRCRVVVKAYDR